MNKYRLSKNFTIGHTAGFSLLEMVVYSALLGIVAVLLMHSLFAGVRAWTDMRLSHDMNRSALSVFDRMAFEIRASYDIYTPASVLGSSPGRLSLLKENDAGVNSTAEFYIATSSVRIKENGADAGPLTPDNATVNSFIVRPITTTHSKGVKIELSMTVTRGALSRTRTFYNTFVLRGSY